MKTSRVLNTWPVASALLETFPTQEIVFFLLPSVDMIAKVVSSTKNFVTTATVAFQPTNDRKATITQNEICNKI